MACGHCRRPRKEILAFNFDQLCWIRGLSSSPKSQGGSKVVLRGSKMAPEIASWDPENSPGRPEAHPGRALALPAPRKAPGSVRAAADCTPPCGHPGDPGPTSASQPTSPQALENSSFTMLILLRTLFLHGPEAPKCSRRGSRAPLRTPWALARAPPGLPDASGSPPESAGERAGCSGLHTPRRDPRWRSSRICAPAQLPPSS